MHQLLLLDVEGESVRGHEKQEELAACVLYVGIAEMFQEGSRFVRLSIQTKNHITF